MSDTKLSNDTLITSEDFDEIVVIFKKLKKMWDESKPGFYGFYLIDSDEDHHE